MMLRTRALGCISALAALLSLGPLAHTQAQQSAAKTGQEPAAPRRVVSGTVFDDANGNGRRDAGEQGVAGVHVSDEVTVVLSAPDGTYRLETGTAVGVVFASVPDGWTAPRGFWRVLESNESEARVDFPLRKMAPPKEFTFIHASDTHVDARSLPRLKRLREMTEELRPAFVLITGDLVRDALRVQEAEARSYYEMLNGELARFPAPVWTVPGNHENFGIERHRSLVSPQHPLYGKKMYRHYRGPNYYSFTFGGVRFIGLDTVDIDDLWYYGHVDPVQFEWLRQELAGLPPDTPVVTFNHIPLASATDAVHGYTDEPPAPSLIRVGGVWQYRHIVSNAKDLLELLRPFQLLALGGHMHAREMLVFQTDRGPQRFHQTGAVVAPSNVAGMTSPSGFTLYRVRDGRIDDGQFIPLDPPGSSTPQ